MFPPLTTVEQLTPGGVLHKDGQPASAACSLATPAHRPLHAMHIRATSVEAAFSCTNWLGCLHVRLQRVPQNLSPAVQVILTRLRPATLPWGRHLWTAFGSCRPSPSSSAAYMD